MSFYRELTSLSFLWFSGCCLHIMYVDIPKFSDKVYMTLKNGPNPLSRDRNDQL